MATIQVHKKYAFKWYEKFYFMSISAGMWVTLKHFVKSAFLRRMVTVSYPEKKMPLSSRFRGLHRLKRNEKGQERCTACYCCQWVCPADAIQIVAAEVTPERQYLHPEDKYAVSRIATLIVAPAATPKVSPLCNAGNWVRPAAFNWLYKAKSAGSTRTASICTT